MAAPTLFVGIPVLNRLDLLVRAIDALDYACDVVVVNNNARDQEFGQALRQFLQERGHGLIEPGRNLGVAASWNLLLKTAFGRGYDQALLSSNDTIVAPDSLAAAASQPLSDDVAIWQLHSFDCFLVPRLTIERVGWFDENFYPAYKEDQDFCYRCQLAGLRCAIVPGASAETVGSATLRSNANYSSANARTHARNVHYYVAKWGGDWNQEQFQTPFDRQDVPLSWWPAPGPEQAEWDWDAMRPTVATPQPRVEFGSTALPACRTDSLITGVVLARNESANIVDCLAALRPHVAEIILIDMESTDNTVELARPWVSKVLYHRQVPNFDVARNVAIEQAGCEWLWFVDADERIPLRTGLLVNEIVRAEGSQIVAITIPFKTYFCGRWIQHCGWWPGYTMPRVLKRGSFRFSERLHAGVEWEGRGVTLAADPELAIDHFSYQSIAHYVEKLNRYTTTEAQNLVADGALFGWEDGIRRMTRDLWLYYEAKHGHQDGVHGWILSWLSGQYRWLSHAKLLDEGAITRGPASSVPANLDDVLRLIQEELHFLRKASPRLPLGVVWRSAINDASGYATDGRTVLKALARGNRHLRLEESAWSDEQCELPSDDAALLRALARAACPSHWLAITATIPTLAVPDRNASLNILRTTFETDRIPASWHSSLDAFNEVWVFSEANRQAFWRSGAPPEKLRVVPSCVDTEIFSPEGDRRPVPAALRGRFVFLSVFDWQLRKGWDVLVRAYCQEFLPQDGVGLLLKITRHHGHSPELVRRQLGEVLRSIGQSLVERPDVVILEELLSEKQMASLYRSVGAFVLATRGEGWGRPYLEAMACGVPVIGTAGSGQGDFLHERNAFQIPATEVDVSPAAAAEIPVFAGHRWFEPDGTVLQSVLRRAATDAAERNALSQHALKEVRTRWGVARASQELEQAISAAEERFRPRKLKDHVAGDVCVEWEGELFARHSFSVINEQLCDLLADAPGVTLALRRVRRNPVHDDAEARRLLPLVGRELPGGPNVTVRHAFPPNWNPPQQGKWVHIQPWEFGCLPTDWLAPLRQYVDEIWAPSHYVRKVYERSGISPKKIQVIPWGVDPDVFDPALPALLLPTAKSFRFLFVGGTLPRKGFDLVLEAYLLEFSRDEDVCLVVKDMGVDSFYRYGNCRDQVQRAQRDRGNPEIVYWDHHLTGGQLASLFRACHTLVAPYRGEGFGLPILEAMACGLAPIVPQGGPTDDFVTPKTGFLLSSEEVPCSHEWELCGTPLEFKVSLSQLRETMRRAFTDRDRTREMGKRASRVVRSRFTWERTASLMRKRLLALASSEHPKPKRRRKGVLPVRPSTARPLISLCMIVRNSARTLGAALETARPWVDEMIVVDTGSIDETPAIAAQLGAQVYHFPWCDDFSAARNESLRHATGEWLFWMDSDDTLDAENGRALRALLQNGLAESVSALVMQVHCPGPGSNGQTDVTTVDHVKVFRNGRNLAFDGRVHEQVLPSIRREGGEVLWTELGVVHSGADHTPEGRSCKQERDLRLLQLELADRPEHPFTLFNLGMTYADMELFDEATGFLRRSLAVSNPADSHVRKLYALLINALWQLQRFDEALSVCHEGLVHYPDDPELKFRQAMLAAHFGRLRDAERFYLAALSQPGEKYFSSIDRGILGYKSRHNLGLVYLEMGKLAHAEAQFRQAVEESPRFTGAWRCLGDALLKQEKWEEAQKVASQLCAEADLKVIGLLMLADLFRTRGDLKSTRATLEQATVADPDSVEAWDALGRLLFEEGKLVEAEAVLRHLVELAPSDAAALYNLGTALLGQERFAEAVDWLHQSLAIRADSVPTLVSLGRALQGMGRIDEARVVWVEAARLSPQDRELRELVGTL